MGFARILSIVALCVGLLAHAASSLAQEAASKASKKQDDIPKSIAESVSGPMQFAEGSFLGVAQAMPEEKYGFIPTAGEFHDARSFGEQVKHVACAQFAFFNEFEGKKPPDDCERGGHDPAKTKGRTGQVSQGFVRLRERRAGNADGEERFGAGRRPLRRAEYEAWDLRGFSVAHHRSLRATG
jgi:hypothetical protein